MGEVEGEWPARDSRLPAAERSLASVCQGPGAHSPHSVALPAPQAPCTRGQEQVGSDRGPRAFEGWPLKSWEGGTRARSSLALTPAWALLAQGNP